LEAFPQIDEIDLDSLQNGLGVFLAGGLGGFLYLQKKEKVQVEEQLSSELSSERSTVNELKHTVSTTSASLITPKCSSNSAQTLL